MYVCNERLDGEVVYVCNVKLGAVNNAFINVSLGQGKKCMYVT